MIRRSIDFCVEINEPDFLFLSLFPYFLEKHQTSAFADEIKPYILMGCYQNYMIPEEILKDSIISYHQN